MTRLLDTRHSAETPEGITLALRPAGVVPRFYACVLDLLIRGALMIAVFSALAALGRVGAAVGLLAWFAIEWLYPVLFELLPGSATPGKRALGLRVVMDSGLPVTPAASLLRNVLRVADFLPVLYASGGLSILLRADFKRLGDLAAGTLVVYAGQTGLHGALPEAVPRVPTRPLSPREQSAVLAWAGRANSLTPARHDELARLAASITPGTPSGERDASTTLLGVAQWVLGRR